MRLIELQPHNRPQSASALCRFHALECRIRLCSHSDINQVLQRKPNFPTLEIKTSLQLHTMIIAVGDFPNRNTHFGRLVLNDCVVGSSTVLIVIWLYGQGLEIILTVGFH